MSRAIALAVGIGAICGAACTATDDGTERPGLSVSLPEKVLQLNDDASHLVAEENRTEGWLLSFVGQSSNHVIWQGRFRDWLPEVLPKAELYLGMTDDRGKQSISSAARELLGGPPEMIRLVDAATVELSACRAHSCDEKAALFVNIKTDVVLLALGVYFFETDAYTGKPYLLLATNRRSCDGLQGELSHVASWVRRKYPGGHERVRCIGSDRNLLDASLGLTVQP